MIDVWTGPYRESYLDMPTNISVEGGQFNISIIDHGRHRFHIDWHRY